MIKSITFPICGGNSRTNDGLYYRNLYNLSRRERKFEFSDGINIVIGANGCGKSTLLRLLGMKMSIWEKDSIRQTVVSHKDLLDITSVVEDYREALDEKIDSWFSFNYNVDYTNPLTYNITQNSLNPRGVLDIMGTCGSYKDKDYSFKGAIVELMDSKNFSNGESSINLLMKVMSVCKPTWEVDIKKLRESQFPFPAEIEVESFINWYNGCDFSDKPTLLIDELDEGLDIINQSIFWNRIIPMLAKDFQIIIVSHSFLGIKFYQSHIDKVNLISFYDKKQLNYIKQL